jgi:hypothetical protein
VLPKVRLFKQAVKAIQVSRYSIPSLLHFKSLVTQNHSFSSVITNLRGLSRKLDSDPIDSADDSWDSAESASTSDSDDHRLVLDSG